LVHLVVFALEVSEAGCGVLVVPGLLLLELVLLFGHSGFLVGDGDAEPHDFVVGVFGFLREVVDGLGRLLFELGQFLSLVFEGLGGFFARELLLCLPEGLSEVAGFFLELFHLLCLVLEGLLKLFFALSHR
jgi:hypothetical protein